MQSFLSDGDEEAFKAAVALYVASARHRQEPIEKVVAALTKLGTSVEGYQKHGHTLFESTRLHQLAFAGILRAFYGDVAADSGSDEGAQGKADAPGHNRSGTWPGNPAD